MYEVGGSLLEAVSRESVGSRDRTPTYAVVGSKTSAWFPEAFAIGNHGLSGVSLPGSFSNLP